MSNEPDKQGKQGLVVLLLVIVFLLFTAAIFVSDLSWSSRFVLEGVMVLGYAAIAAIAWLFDE